MQLRSGRHKGWQARSVLRAHPFEQLLDHEAAVRQRREVLASILGECRSENLLEVQRGGKPKRRWRPPHHGMGMLSSGMPASMSTGV